MNKKTRFISPARKGRRHRTLALTVAIVLTGVFVLLCQFIPLSDASSRLDAFPMQGTYFASREIPADPVETPVLGEARLMKRVCQTATQRFILSVIDGTRNRHAVHDPAYCLRGAGWEITGSETIPLPGGEAAKLTLTKAGRTTEAVYWFSDGKKRQASAIAQWLGAAARRLTFGGSGPAPVLVLLFPEEGSGLDWPELWREVPELWTL